MRALDRAGVLHRDLKLEHFMRTASGALRIVDYSQAIDMSTTFMGAAAPRAHRECLGEEEHMDALRVAVTGSGAPTTDGFELALQADLEKERERIQCLPPVATDLAKERGRVAALQAELEEAYGASTCADHLFPRDGPGVDGVTAGAMCDKSSHFLARHVVDSKGASAEHALWASSSWPQKDGPLWQPQNKDGPIIMHCGCL